jgi:hypothetical protein
MVLRRFAHHEVAEYSPSRQMTTKSSPHLDKKSSFSLLVIKKQVGAMANLRILPDWSRRH